MLKSLAKITGCALTLAIAASIHAQVGTPAAQGVTASAVTAAQKFLGTLNDTQRARAAYAFNDPIKPNWHNLPPQMHTRAGVRMMDLSPAQRELAQAVVKSVLSNYGYSKVQNIISADEYLGTDMGVGFPTGPGAYMLAIFGTPSATAPWSIQYNGHHLGVNVTLVGANDVLAPTLTAAYPNMYVKDGKQIFVLGDEANRALKLIQSLDNSHRAKATAPMQIWDFLLGPGHDGQVLQPEGLKGSEMTTAQKEMLLDVAAAWVNIINEGTAQAKMAEIRRTIDDTYFLWSGDTTRAGNAYFRVQGPTIWIEYSPQVLGGPGSARGGGGRARGGRDGGAPLEGRGRDNFEAALNDPNRKLDPTHVHTVYRDFTNDYAKRFIAAQSAQR